MRISVRSTPDVPAGVAPSGGAARHPRAGPARCDPRVDGVMRVESPMVGTFYRAPTRDAPPFVEVGDVVGAGQTLCILEAMKLMNEVKSDLEAIMRKIHVDNAQPVEFGQVLFELEPLAGRPAVARDSPKVCPPRARQPLAQPTPR